MFSVPEFLAIGHLCYDRTPEGFILGGAASYAGLCAMKMGLEVGILTSTDSAFQFKNLFANTAIKNVDSDNTTIFNNIYKNGIRSQQIEAVANTIETKDIPDTWKKAKVVHIGPIANEVSKDLLTSFDNAIICVNPQGWMRQWNDRGDVFSKDLDDWSFLDKADIVIMSEEDLKGIEYRLEEVIGYSKVFILTKGKEPLSIYTEGKSLSLPVFDVEEVDPTGAGDVFSTGFLVKYTESEDIVKAGVYGICAASFCVTGVGIEKLPTKEDVDKRYYRYLEKYNINDWIL